MLPLGGLGGLPGRLLPPLALLLCQQLGSSSLSCSLGSSCGGWASTLGFSLLPAWGPAAGHTRLPPSRPLLLQLQQHLRCSQLVMLDCEHARGEAFLVPQRHARPGRNQAANGWQVATCCCPVQGCPLVAAVRCLKVGVGRDQQTEAGRVSFCRCTMQGPQPTIASRLNVCRRCQQCLYTCLVTVTRCQQQRGLPMPVCCLSAGPSCQQRLQARCMPIVGCPHQCRG